MTTVFTKQIKI